MRVRGFCVGVCSILVAAASLAAQRPAPDTGAAKRLLADLANDERSVEAVRAFVRMGSDGAAILTAAIRDPWFRAEEKQLATAIYALGRIGDAAAGAAPVLLAELPAAQGDVLRNVFWALGEIGPAAEAGGTVVLTELKKWKPTPGGVHVEWAFACRRLELGNDIDDSLATLLRSESHADIVAACAVLLRRAPGVHVPRDELLEAFTRVHGQWLQWGDGQKRGTLELARAVVRHCPDAPEADVARRALVYHFDVEVRVDAAMQLGRSVSSAASGADREATLTALRASLTDGSVLVRREAVTSLGMLGMPAARADLEPLQQHPDAQIRARAAAALRALDRAAK